MQCQRWCQDADHPSRFNQKSGDWTLEKKCITLGILIISIHLFQNHFLTK